jgi:hypothetical protein
MKSRIIAVALLLLPSAFAFKPSLINGRTLTNPTVGFNGISVTFPDGYEIYQPILNRSLPTNDVRQMAWRMATDNETVMPGLHTDEITVFGKSGMAMAFGIEHSSGSWTYSAVRPDQRLSSMYGESQTLSFAEGRVFLRKAEMVAGRPVAKIGRTFHKEFFVNVVYVTTGTLRDRFVINGVAFQWLEPKLEADMTAVLATLITAKQTH